MHVHVDFICANKKIWNEHTPFIHSLIYHSWISVTHIIGKRRAGLWPLLHKEIISLPQGGTFERLCRSAFSMHSIVCLSSSCSSFPIKFQIISIFCLLCPLDFSGARIMIFFTNSLTIICVSSRIPTYLRITVAKLSKSILSFESEESAILINVMR